VALILGLSYGYIWALNGPKWVYKALAFVAIIVIFTALFLPDEHVFKARIIEGLHWWKWAVAIGIPVLGYGLLVRWIKKKADARYDS